MFTSVDDGGERTAHLAILSSDELTTNAVAGEAAIEGVASQTLDAARNTSEYQLALEQLLGGAGANDDRHLQLPRASVRPMK